MIVTVTAGKGGVGKTTLCSVLIGHLHAAGADVQGVDTDPQADLIRWLGPAMVTAAPRAPTAAVTALDRPGRILIVDTPPGLTDDAAGAVEAAHAVVAVTGPGWGDLAALGAVERWTQPTAIAGCRFDPRRRLHREAETRLAARYGARWVGAIPARAEAEAASAEARPVALDSDVASAAAGIWRAVMALIEEA